MKKDVITKQLTEMIIPFWKSNIDSQYGGFYGERTFNLLINPHSEKSAVLMTRYLWSFSAIYNNGMDSEADYFATIAYDFIQKYLLDQKNGGLYWSVHYDGLPKSTIKHLYAHSFYLYALSEYYKINQDLKILDDAIKEYEFIEHKFYSANLKGYVEEFNQDFSHLSHTQVGPTNLDFTFSTNSVLHLIEAYTNLYTIWPNDKLKKQLVNLLNLFDRYVIDTNGYCKTFFDANWQTIGDMVSYAHDIETYWLLSKTLDYIPNASLTEQLGKIPKYLISHGLDKNQIILMQNNRETPREWWAFAEATIGFVHAFKITKNPKFSKIAKKHWDFIQEYIIDSRLNSEWHAHLDSQNQIIPSPISDPWKGPYHTVRMYLELINRL